MSQSQSNRSSQSSQSDQSKQSGQSDRSRSESSERSERSENSNQAERSRSENSERSERSENSGQSQQQSFTSGMENMNSQNNLKTLPARTYSQFNRQIEQMMDMFIQNIPGNDMFSRMFLQSAATMMPQVEMEETDDSFIITCDIPVRDERALNVNMQNGYLVISYEDNSSSENRSGRGEDREERDSSSRDRDSSSRGRDSSLRSFQREENDNNRRRQGNSRYERSHSFRQAIPMPFYADVSKVEAYYEHGTLCITLPKMNPDSKNRSSNLDVEFRGRERQGSRAA